MERMYLQQIKWKLICKGGDNATASKCTPSFSSRNIQVEAQDYTFSINSCYYQGSEQLSTALTCTLSFSSINIQAAAQDYTSSINSCYYQGSKQRSKTSKDLETHFSQISNLLTLGMSN